MTMLKNENRIRVYAVNNYKVEFRFDIYLEFSGKREWLMSHRRNGILFNMLKHGIPLGELRRMSGWQKRHVEYLLKVIDEYLEEEKSA
jgi:hypothetical protein